MLTPHRTRLLVTGLLWASVVWIVVFWRLGYLSLLDPDEAHYAQLTREMIHGGHWMVPVLQGVPFLDKPVLYHWLQAGAEWLLGETEFALRLPSACAAVALFWTVWWCGRSLFTPTAGQRAALMFATTPLTFALASIGVFDMVYTACLFGAVASLLVSAHQRRRGLEIVGWTLLATAVMVKGPVAVVLVVLFGLTLAIVPSTRPLVARLHWDRGLSLVALLSAPWFVYMAAVYREAFVEQYVLAGNLWYFTRPAEFSTRQSDALFYLRTYLGACFPWSVLAVGAGVDAIRAGKAGGAGTGGRDGVGLLDPRTQALWIWTLLVLAFFSLAGFKLDTYIFPAAPATCLLLAAALEDGSLVRRRATAIAVWISGGALVIGGLVLGATIFRIDLGLSWRAAGLPLALAGGGIAAIARWRRDEPARIVPALVPMLLAIYAVVVVEGFPVLERSRPTAPIGRWVNQHLAAGVPLGVYGLDDWRSSLRFYAGHPLQILHDEREVSAYFDAHPDGFAVMLRADAIGLRGEGVPIQRVGGRRAIVGRTGKYVRRQLWGRIVVTRPGPTPALMGADWDIPDR